MPNPIYVVAGQSNAGSLAGSAFYSQLTGTNSSVQFSLYFQGSTSLAPSTTENDWYPADDGDPSTGELTAGLADHIAQLLADNPDSYLAGIIWVQGEADTANAESTTSYQANLLSLIDTLRMQFGAEFEFLALALSQHAPWAMTREYWNQVREAQLAIASSEDNVLVVDPDILIEQLSEGEAVYRDDVHYEGEFADALLRYALSAFDGAESFGSYAPAFGTSLGDRLLGTANADHLRGLAGIDRLEGNAGDDRLFGGSGDDVMLGGDGADYIDGGMGLDRMVGGAGDDIYVVDAAADIINEAVNAGTDTVYAHISHALAVNIENLRAADGAGSLSLTGNRLNNEITGGTGNDTLDGNAGIDTLFGLDGDDLLIGGDGGDILDGGAGANILRGGLGNDRYRIRSSADVIEEAAGEGFDVVSVSASFVLQAGVEIEQIVMLPSAGAGSVIGNEFANIVNGNALGNLIDGKAGADRILGGGGNDEIMGGEGADTIDGGDGDDTIACLLDGDVIEGGLGSDRVLLTAARESVMLFTDGETGQVLLVSAEPGHQLLARLSGIELIEFQDAAINLAESPQPANQAPSFSTPDAATVTEGDTGTGLVAAATDPEGFPVTYSIAPDGDGALFALAEDGTIRFVTAPDFEHPADADGDNVYTLTLIASDGFTVSRLPITVTVTGADEAPVVALPAAVSVSEGTLDTGLIALGTDPECQSLSYAIADEADGALFTLGPGGSVQFAVPPDHEAPTDADGDNVYHIVLIASDGTLETRHEIAITVADVDEAPDFAMPPSATLDEGSLNTGLIPAATDPEGRALSYAIAAEGDGALFTLAEDGTIRFLAAPDFEHPADADGDNIYNLVLIASDGVTESRIDLSVTVANLDENPVFALPAATTIEEGNTDTGLVAGASDPEGQSISLAIGSEADGGMFMLDPEGRIVFRTAPDHETPADADGDNIYHIVLIASDGTLETRHEIAITVADVDEAPAFAMPPSATLEEGSLDTGLIPAATDPEGRALSYAIATEGDGALFALGEDGTIRFLAAPDFESPADADGDNNYNLVLIASDGVTESRIDLSVTVQDKDEAPAFAMPTSASVSEGSRATGLLIAAADPEGQPLSYAIAAEEDGALFTLAPDGMLRFIAAPDFEAPADANHDNVYTVILTASDGRHETRQEVTVTVTDINPEFEYSATGTLLSKTVRDLVDAYDWQVATTFYSESGKVSERRLLMDNADEKVFHFDAAGLNVDQIYRDLSDRRAWDQFTIRYDNQQRVTEREYLFDDGDMTTTNYGSNGRLTARTYFDGDNDVSWLRDIYTYEPDGSLLSRTVYYDSGRWDSYSYDSRGALMEHVRHNVDGTTVVL